MSTNHGFYLTCMLKYLNGNKILRAKIPTKDVLRRQILTDSIAKQWGLKAFKYMAVTGLLF